jgi:hypothetical protein
MLLASFSLGVEPSQSVPLCRGIAVKNRRSQRTQGQAFAQISAQPRSRCRNFPPLDADAGGEEFDRLVAVTQDPSNAMAAAEEATGAVRERWVNENIVQKIRRLRSSRPALEPVPDGHPWPSRGACS